MSKSSPCENARDIASPGPHSPSVAAASAVPPHPFPDAGGSDSRTALDRLIPLLQDCADAVVADAGIARFSAATLDAIAHLAHQEAETLCERAQLLLRLLEHGLEAAPALEQGELLCLAQHAQRLLYDQQRWRDLSDNAVYYRDHREVARRITTLRQGGVPNAAGLNA